MGKTLVLGNEQTKNWAGVIPDYEFVQMQLFSLGEDGERKLCEFVINTIPSDCEAIAIDVDGISNPELCLALAMTIRLSFVDIKVAALSPILFVSRATQDIMLGYKFTPVILTGSVAFELPENVADALEIMQPLSFEEYKTKFLDIIKILPNATEGRHSLANQWGADVLSRFVIGNEINNELIRKARLSLYFRYVRALSLSSHEIENFVKGVENCFVPISSKNINFEGKKILLIDDEADKGWDDVLRTILPVPNSDFKTFQEQVPDYESLSDAARKEIESGKYDLIFLDLRMNGVAEEEMLEPNDFSGMKILTAIKEQNKGNQVIMFTASNKAWNMRALLEAGADGYYIKESPEYSFPASYSENNALELCNSINQCLENGYLRKVYQKVKQVKKLIQESRCFEDRTDEILGSIDVAYDLLSKSNVKTKYKVYSYLQLFFVIEEYVKMPSLFDLTEKDLYLYNGETRYRILKDKESRGKETFYQSVISMKNGHYVLKQDEYRGRFLETNFLVSALLIFKFGEENSASHQWTKIYTLRNDFAHSKVVNISSEDYYRILDFMLFFFDNTKSNWRNPNQAFPDVNPQEQLALLQAKFNSKK